MEELKKRVLKIWDYIKDKKVTYISLIVTTIYFIILVLFNISGNKIFTGVIPYTLISIIFNSFFCESVFKKNSTIYITDIILICLNSILLSINLFVENVDYLTIFAIGYMISITVYTTYNLYKKSKLEFYDFVTRFINKLFYIFLILAVFTICIFLLMLLFIFLVNDNNYIYNVLSSFYIVLFGFYIIPNIIKTLDNINKIKISKFFKTLILYIILPVSIMAMVIIYTHIIIRIVSSEVPSNFVLPVISFLFIVVFVIYNILRNYKSNKVLNIISIVLPYVFIPFIILQIYTANIRYQEYGITPLRYVSYIYIVFEIVSILLMIIKKGKYLEYDFFALIIFLIICTNPFINAEKVAYLNQKHIVESNIKDKDFDDLSSEEKNRIISAYNYLKVLNKENDIDIDASNLEKIKNTDKIVLTDKDFLNINEYNIVDSLNVSGYSNLYFVDTRSQDTYDSNNIKLYNNETEILSLNMTNILSYLQHNNNYIKENNLVKINDNSVLIIDDFYLRYNLEKNEIERISIDGYLLTK